MSAGKGREGAMSTLDYCPESLVFVVDTASEIQEAIPHPGGGKY